MSLFTENFHVTETVGGVNPFSPHWKDIYDRLCTHNRVINGDFSKYDKKISIGILEAVFSVMIGVKKAHRSIGEMEMRVLRGIMTDTVSPIILMGKDVLQLAGSLSSGILLTFTVNNIANSIYIRLAYIHCYMNHFKLNNDDTAVIENILHHFEENVVFYALGDDNTFSVSDEALVFFSFDKIQDYFALLGIKYTNAAKTDDVYGSLPVSEATIGKRRFVPDESGRVFAPLERPSIGKMVTMALDDGPLTLEQKTFESFISACYETAQYGRAEYNYFVTKFLQIMNDCQIVYDGTRIPSYDDIITKQFCGDCVPWSPSVEMGEFHMEPTSFTYVFKSIKDSIMRAFGRKPRIVPVLTFETYEPLSIDQYDTEDSDTSDDFSYSNNLMFGERNRKLSQQSLGLIGFDY